MRGAHGSGILVKRLLHPEQRKDPPWFPSCPSAGVPTHISLDPLLRIKERFSIHILSEGARADFTPPLCGLRLTSSGWKRRWRAGPGGEAGMPVVRPCLPACTFFLRVETHYQKVRRV